jgi:hypothetical protein
MFNSSIQLKGAYGFPSSEEPVLNPDLSRSAYGYGSYLFTINRSFRVEPQVMLKYNANKIHPFRFDLTTTAYLFDQFETGVSYRFGDGIAAFCAIRLNLVQVKYLFELPLSGHSPLGFTSHMIQLGFNLGQKIQ